MCGWLWDSLMLTGSLAVVLLAASVPWHTLHMNRRFFVSIYIVLEGRVHTHLTIRRLYLRRRMKLKPKEVARRTPLASYHLAVAEEAVWDWGGWRTFTLPKVAHSVQSWAPQCNFWGGYSPPSPPCSAALAILYSIVHLLITYTLWRPVLPDSNAMDSLQRSKFNPKFPWNSHTDSLAFPWFNNQHVFHLGAEDLGIFRRNIRVTIIHIVITEVEAHMQLSGFGLGVQRWTCFTCLLNIFFGVNFRLRRFHS